MLHLAIILLATIVLGSPDEESRQHPLAPGTPGFPGIPGDSIVVLCPESRETDILLIDRMINYPQKPVLNEEIDVLIWGNLSRDLSPYSTVDYQINATANNGDSGWLNGTFHICDYLEKMHQPPYSNEPEKACPPIEGAIFIDYAMWFADFLVAPGRYSVKFDAKTLGGDRIYCLQTEFSLQCPPEVDRPECMRDISDKNKINCLMQS